MKKFFEQKKKNPLSRIFETKKDDHHYSKCRFFVLLVLRKDKEYEKSADQSMFG